MLTLWVENLHNTGVVVMMVVVPSSFIDSHSNYFIRYLTPPSLSSSNQRKRKQIVNSESMKKAIH